MRFNGEDHKVLGTVLVVAAIVCATFLYCVGGSATRRPVPTVQEVPRSAANLEVANREALETLPRGIRSARQVYLQDSWTVIVVSQDSHLYTLETMPVSPSGFPYFVFAGVERDKQSAFIVYYGGGTSSAYEVRFQDRAQRTWYRVEHADLIHAGLAPEGRYLALHVDLSDEIVVIDLEQSVPPQWIKENDKMRERHMDFEPTRAEGRFVDVEGRPAKSLECLRIVDWAWISSSRLEIQGYCDTDSEMKSEYIEFKPL